MPPDRLGDRLDTARQRLRDEQPADGALLDVKAAGRLLNVPASWIAAEARANRIPHVKFGRYVRFEREELQAWWRSRARGPWRDRGRAAAAAREFVRGPTR